MCHQCKKIVQIENGKIGEICGQLSKKSDTAETPLGYEQITLLANYDCLFGGKGWNQLGEDASSGLVKEKGSDFWKYVHPYGQVHF